MGFSADILHHWTHPTGVAGSNGPRALSLDHPPQDWLQGRGPGNPILGTVIRSLDFFTSTEVLWITLCLALHTGLICFGAKTPQQHSPWAHWDTQTPPPPQDGDSLSGFKLKKNSFHVVKRNLSVWVVFPCHMNAKLGMIFNLRFWISPKYGHFPVHLNAHRTCT